MEDYKNIINHLKLDEYFIDDDCKINFRDIYEDIIPKFKNLESEEEETLRIPKDNYFIQISKTSPYFCDIELFQDKEYIKRLKKISNVFTKSLSIYYKMEKIEIAFLEQFDDIPYLFKIKHPTLSCLNHSTKMDYNINFLITHLLSFNSYNCMIEVFDRSIKEDDSKRQFYRAFNFNENNNEFENPKHFDINYESYFDYYHYQIKDKKFKFLDDDKKSRVLFIANLLCAKKFLGRFWIYYGLTGMGKSITLIKAFKYKYKHEYFGILYIHCKCLYENINKNINKVKKILKDEIVFLFKNEYDIFEKCKKYIDNYNNENKGFLDFVINIIKNFCKNKEKKYIFIFDQYKPEYDPNKVLEELNNSLIRKDQKYGMIACCSMDNETVRELKVKNLSSYLFQEELDNIADNVCIEEITKIFDISKYAIDDGKIFDKTLNKIGKNLRNFIVLKDYFRNNDYNGMKKYVQEMKDKIENNLKEFFKLKKAIKEEDETLNLSYLYNILSFTVDTDYTLDYIRKIKNNIPFKYFDIKIKKNKYFDDTAKIVFNYELVGEVMNKIYKYIIYENKNIYQIFDNINLDGGALGGLYEKYVIHFMEPDKYTKQKQLFKLFNITNIIMVDKFVPTSNEGYSTHNYNIRHLENGDYLFQQNIFGGKAFDCAIIRVKKDYAEVFFFQISIDKKELYSIDELKKYIKTFIDYFSFQFDFIVDPENVYFTYIFHTKNNKNLYNRCKKKKLKCIFFNPSVQQFTNINNAALDNIDYIDDIFVNPYKLNQQDIDMEDMTNVNGTNDIMKPLFILNINQYDAIKNFWKSIFTEFKNNEIEIVYSHNVHSIDENYLYNRVMYLRLLNEYEIEEWTKAIISEKKTEKINVKNNILLFI